MNVFLLLLIFFLFPLKQIPVNAQSNNFAQVQKSNVYLYSESLTPLFEIPYSYYVRLLSDSENEYYNCEYNGIMGYVKKSDIQCCQSVTQAPYLENISFRILASQSAELRSEPSRKKGLSTLLCELDLYETNFSYIGKLQGEEVVPGRGDIWYYAKYSKNNITLTGYIYSGLCDQLSSIPVLSINTTPIPSHNWIVEDEKVEQIPENPQFVLPSQNETLIILIVTIPIIILILILLFSKKSKTTTESDYSNVITMRPKKAKKGKDYYELE